MNTVLANLKLSIERNLGPISMDDIKDVCNELKIKMIKEELTKRLAGFSYSELIILEDTIRKVNEPVKTFAIRKDKKGMN